MKILVSAASKHGATAQIAERIAEVLRESLAGPGQGAEVMVLAPDQAGPAGGSTRWCWAAPPPHCKDPQPGARSGDMY